MLLTGMAAFLRRRSTERVLQKVLLCRHGQGYHNELDEKGERRLQLKDASLTPQGIQEARALKEIGFRPQAGQMA